MDLIKRDNIFNQTSPIKVDRNAFDISHKVISSWDMGKLYPVSAHEVYPNDYEKTMIQTKLIMETLQKPMYQNIKVNFYEYDVAYRNLWKHWRNYYTRGRKGNFTAQEPKVNLNCKSNIKGSLFDYLGFPLQSQLKGDVFVSAFPFVAYDFIYFWNFINPELQENVIYNIQDSLFTENNVTGARTFTDELDKFLYYADDFYLVNESGIPLYTRCLGGYYSKTADFPAISYNSELGKNDRYSYTSDVPIGVVYENTLKDNELTPLFWPQSQFVGLINDETYRNAVNLGFIYNVNWQRDYFTSAHLSQQQGSPFSLPINTSITGNGNVSFTTGNLAVGILDDGNVQVAASLTDNPIGSEGTQPARDYYGVFPNSLGSGNSNLYTNSGNINIPATDIASKLQAISSSFSNNDLRLVWQVNMIKESVLFNKKNFEYASYLKYFFGRGPNTSDLQQPVYIGSFSLDMFIGEIMQTSSTTSTSALGDRGGISSVTDSDYIEPYTFDEIGLSMLVMYIAPNTIYQSSQGVNRQWLRNDCFDYYNPLLSNIGLQEIQNQEVYAQGNSEDAEPFGYTAAFNELRYIPDIVTSDMRDTLDIWHLARKYDSLPVLNSDYLLCRPSKRIFQVQMEDVANITGVINIVKLAYRDMPELAIPQLIDHRY